MRTVIAFFIICSGILAGVQASPAERRAGYVLGPEDQLTVRVLELEEFSPQNLPPVRVDSRGNIRLPILGRIHASGLGVEQLEANIAERLSKIMQNPEVTVAIATFRSHPVSVLGAVKNPGVHQITGQMTLFEVLSLAGGLNPDAGNIINITRRVDSAPLALPGVTRDPSGGFVTGHLNVRSVMEAKNPAENIQALANDIITVPKAELVYVIGAVKRSGGFVLSEKEQMSVLQALSLAEGLDHAAAAKNAHIFRPVPGGNQRTEIPVNIQRMLQGRGQDAYLRANDILFIPTSVTKNASIRALETAIQLGTGIAVYRR